ncbi:hypothetical protein F4703DRAFT_1849278 [Phycomyces blakesleeanus]
MKFSFAFVLISLVLGLGFDLDLVSAAPPSSTVPTYNPAVSGENCFSLTNPVNGTVWDSYGTYAVSWDVKGECQGDYYVYMLSVSTDTDGQISLGHAQHSTLTVDLASGGAVVNLSQDEHAGDYVFAISTDTAEGLDYNDYAFVKVI